MTAQVHPRARPLTATTTRRGVFPRGRTAARCWRWSLPLHMRRAVFCWDTPVGRTSTFGDGVAVLVSAKGADGNWSDVATTKTVHDTRRMLLDFGAQEVEIHGLRSTFGGLDVDEEHGIYEVLARGGSVVETARLRSRPSLLEESRGDGVSWTQLSPNPVLSVGGLHERFQATAGLVLRGSHISVEDLDTWVPETGDVDASRITLRVRGVSGGALQKHTSVSSGWSSMARDVGSPADAPVYSFSFAELRAGKIGFPAGDGTNSITFTMQAEDDNGELSDSDPDNSGDRPSSVRILLVGLEKLIGGRTSSVNSDGALTPGAAIPNLWRSAVRLRVVYRRYSWSCIEDRVQMSFFWILGMASRVLRPRGV